MRQLLIGGKLLAEAIRKARTNLAARDAQTIADKATALRDLVEGLAIEQLLTQVTQRQT